MGKNRFLDEVLSDVKQYYDSNKIVGGAGKSRNQLYLQFSNLMAGVAKLFPSDMDLTTPITVAIVASDNFSPDDPIVNPSATDVPTGDHPTADHPTTVPLAASTNVLAGNDDSDSSTSDPTSETNNYKVIIEKAKLISENLKKEINKIKQKRTEEQGEPDVETGELILGEQGKPNAVLISKEGTFYTDGFTNEDIVFRK